MGLGRGLRVGLGLRLLLDLRIADRDDLQDRVLLAMTHFAAIVVAAALLEDDDLVGLGLGDDLCADLETLGRLDLVAVAGEQDIVERDRIASLSGKLFDDDFVSGGNAILFAARAHDCEHRFIPFKTSIAAQLRGRSRYRIGRGGAESQAN